MNEGKRLLALWLDVIAAEGEAKSADEVLRRADHVAGLLLAEARARFGEHTDRLLLQLADQNLEIASLRELVDQKDKVNDKSREHIEYLSASKIPDRQLIPGRIP